MEPAASALHGLLRAHGATVAVAESLTGGLLGAALTSAAGASVTFCGGITAYATPAKVALLGVDEALLVRHGAVHPEVALAMARGARERFAATYALALTGVAGPEPQDGQPPGTVHVALVVRRGSRRGRCGWPATGRPCGPAPSGLPSSSRSSRSADPIHGAGRRRDDYSVTLDLAVSVVSLRNL